MPLIVVTFISCARYQLSSSLTYNTAAGACLQNGPVESTPVGVYQAGASKAQPILLSMGFTLLFLLYCRLPVEKRVLLNVLF